MPKTKNPEKTNSTKEKEDPFADYDDFKDLDWSDIAEELKKSRQVIQQRFGVNKEGEKLVESAKSTKTKSKP